MFIYFIFLGSGNLTVLFKFTPYRPRFYYWTNDMHVWVWLLMFCCSACTIQRSAACKEEWPTRVSASLLTPVRFIFAVMKRRLFSHTPLQVGRWFEPDLVPILSILPKLQAVKQNEHGFGLPYISQHNGWPTVALLSLNVNTGWAIKNRTCFSVDNSAMVTRRKASHMSNLLECCRQRGPNLHNK